jgi:hypothetical protein
VIHASTAAVVLAVAGIAAYISYWHAYAVIRQCGESGVTALLEPGTIDGLVYGVLDGHPACGAAPAAGAAAGPLDARSRHRGLARRERGPGLVPRPGRCRSRGVARGCAGRFVRTARLDDPDRRTKRSGSRARAEHGVPQLLAAHAIAQVRGPAPVGPGCAGQTDRGNQAGGTTRKSGPGGPGGPAAPGTAAAGAVFTVPHVAQVRFYLASAPRGRYPTPCREALYRRMSIGLPVPTCFDTLLEAKLGADASRDLIMQTAQTIGPARDDDSPPRGQPGRRNSQDAAVIQRQLRSYYERLRPHR